MNELNQSIELNEILNNIREELNKPDPFFVRIVDYLYDIRTKEELQSLSDTEFYDIVAKIFKLNPQYYMTSIYGTGRFYGYINKTEMAKYIIEKYCLYDGEQILCIVSGNLEQITDVIVSVNNGIIIVTNYRIIAQGKLKVKKIKKKGSPQLLDQLIINPLINSLRGNSDRSRSKNDLLERSTNQRLPCYGYQFPIKNHFNLNKWRTGIEYNLKWGSVRISLHHPTEEIIQHLFGAFFSKNVDQIVNKLKIKTFDLTRKSRGSALLRELRRLWKRNEYLITDSDYLKIIQGIYKLDPLFFMNFIYPKMKSWKFSSFLKIKDEFIELIKNLNKNFPPDTFYF